MKQLNVCLTFDVDFKDYYADQDIDEFFLIIPKLVKLFRELPQWKATWFIRIDAHMKEVYGTADYAFQRYSHVISSLMELGHEVGWHPHPYTFVANRWVQNTEPSSIVAELEMYAHLAASYGLNATRMGWGFHCNETLQWLAEYGFMVDNSAIPRPVYSWEKSEKDWSITPSFPYHPSRSDYRLSGEPKLPILEIPISVGPIKAPYDTEEVLRYFNFAYHPQALRAPLESWFLRYDHLVTITHPTELMPSDQPNPLLSFDVEVFKENLYNLENLIERKEMHLNACTISSFAKLVERGKNEFD